MKTRVFYLLIASMIILGSCTNKATKTNTEDAGKTITPSSNNNVPYIIADRYFVRNDYVAKDHPSALIKTEKEFDAIFGKAPIMGPNGKPTVIDFNTQDVIAIIEEPTDRRVEIIVETVKQDGGTIVVSYKLTQGEKSLAVIQPAKVIVVDKKYEGEVKLVKTPDSQTSKQ